MPDLFRLGPAVLAGTFPSGTESQPVEGLVLSDLDLGSEARLGPCGADVRYKRKEGLITFPVSAPDPRAKRIRVDSVGLRRDPVVSAGADGGDDGSVAFGCEERRPSHGQHPAGVSRTLVGRDADAAIDGCLPVASAHLCNVTAA